MARLAAFPVFNALQDKGLTIGSNVTIGGNE
jgi:hypothetical protein